MLTGLGAGLMTGATGTASKEMLLVLSLLLTIVGFAVGMGSGIGVLVRTRGGGWGFSWRGGIFDLDSTFFSGLLVLLSLVLLSCLTIGLGIGVDARGEFAATGAEGNWVDFRGRRSRGDDSDLESYLIMSNRHQQKDFLS